MHRSTHAWLPFIGVLALASHAAAQDPPVRLANNSGFDTAYVMDRTELLSARLYMSTKFNAVDLDDQQRGSHLGYRPNSRVNLGVGVSYRALTLNIGVGIPSLNDDDSLRGSTKYLDAQANLYGRRFAINVFAQIYNGYYIDQLSLSGLGTDTAYNVAMHDERLRPDMQQHNLGASVMYIVKNRRFSYRAAFNQDAWQKRSAGSWLVGGNFIMQGMTAERSAVPAAIDTLFAQALHFKRIGQMELGVMGGYGHTFVVKRHLFLSFTGSIGLGLVRSRSQVEAEDGYEVRHDWGGNLHSQARIAMGWNGAFTNIGLSYVNEQSQTALAPQALYSWSVGNFRVFFVHRLHARIGFVDALVRRLGWL